jgi:hypothetical protein
VWVWAWDAPSHPQSTQRWVHRAPLDKHNVRLEPSFMLLCMWPHKSALLTKYTLVSDALDAVPEAHRESCD